MEMFLIVLGIIIVLIGVVVLVMKLLSPWMDRWRSTVEERETVLPGDEFLDNPSRIVNRAVTINASPEKVFPWIVQLGADKSGMYSYTWLERLVGCKMAKVEAIKPEWQNLKEGDLMKMCAGEFAPPPYTVVKVIPDQAIIYGHKEKDTWVELWQFVLVPQSDETIRLITRTRTNMVGGMWEAFNRVAFFMERKMLLTIKRLSETAR